MLQTIVKLLGVTFGVFLRTFLPARRKMVEAREANEKFVWDHSYTQTAVASLVTAFFIALLTLHGLQANAQDLLYLFSASASYGLGLNTLANEVKEWIFG